MTHSTKLHVLKPGLSLMLTVTLALGQQTPSSAPKAGAASNEEQSAVWGSLKPDHDGGKLAGELLIRKDKDPDGQTLSQADEELDVIIQYRETPQKYVDRAIKAGAKVKSLLGDAVVARMTRRAAASLAADPNVVYISPDREVSASANVIDYSSATVNADKAIKAGYDGVGIGIAIIDSGVNEDNEDFQNADCKGTRIVYAENFVNWAEDPGSYGHGTHVAGIASGNGCVADRPGKASWEQAPGIAPAAHLISLRALDTRGKGKDSSLIAAINRAVALKARYNIRVMNISAGRMIKETYTKDPLCQAVEKAWQAGIVVVVAAGNNGRDNTMKTNGYGTITSPGNDPFVITVGAVNDRKTPQKSDDLLLTFSSKGPTLIDQYVKPDIMAPGANVLATKPLGSYLQLIFPKNTLPGDKKNQIPDNAYFWLSGTSMATPMVAGAAAVLLHKEPTLTPDQVKARLMKTASKNFPSQTSWKDPATNITYTAYSDLFTVGAGYLDIQAALNSPQNIKATESAKSPRAKFGSNGKVEIFNDSSNGISGSSIVWGTSVVWGTNVVWGNTVLVNGSNVVWGNSVVWGTSTAAGFNVVWGNNVVWGASAPFSESTSINGEN